MSALRADAHLGADRHVVEQREARELRGHELDASHVGSLARGTPIAATGPWWPTSVEAVRGQLVDVGDERLLGRVGVDVAVVMLVLVDRPPQT